MKSIVKNIIALGLVSLTSLSAQADWRGNLTFEGRYFFNEGLFPGQKNNDLSMSLEPDYFHRIRGDDLTITIKPFVRIDDQDQERTHIDLREFFVYYTKNDWEWRIGLNKVFWGVTESRHLVDIINQTDAIENLDGEDKLGQPMINATWSMENGVLDLFILPGFRERTFPGQHGRLRPALVVDTDHPQYESSQDERHIDVAARWSGTLHDDWDIGVHLFKGTSRDPQFILSTSGDSKPVLTPRYNQITQLGLDVQATLEDWIWKLETIYRDGDPESYSAAVGGFEYTFVGVMDSVINVGALMEYHYDSRGNDGGPFQNDLFLATRLDFSDEQSSEILAGAFFDLEHPTRSFRVEASRRIGQSWKLTGELQVFEHIDRSEQQFDLRRDDFLQLELAWYF